MAHASQLVARNEWGTLTFFPESSTLELAWDDTTRSMNDAGFRETLQLLADKGLELRPINMIVDVTRFYHRPAEATLAWRDEEIIPLYNQAGIKKLAFLATDQTPGTVEKGAEAAPEAHATFPTGWFETRARLEAWLKS